MRHDMCLVPVSEKRQKPHLASSAAGNTTYAGNKGITIQQ